jgi:hypothetical protein
METSSYAQEVEASEAVEALAPPQRRPNTISNIGSFPGIVLCMDSISTPRSASIACTSVET